MQTGAEELGLAGEEVRKAEVDYKAIFEAMGHATALIDDDLTITLANGEFEKLSGYSREEIEGKKALVEFLTLHDVREIKDYFSQRGLGYNAPPKNYTILFTNKQGETMEAVVTLTMVPQLRKSILTLAEVRKLREVEESLKSSEARFRSLFEHSPLGITLSRGDSMIYVNPAFLRMFGLDETTKLQGRTFMNFIAPISRQLITERLELRMQGQDMAGSLAEAIVLRKDGTTFPVQIDAFSIGLHDGPASVTFISDITERKRAEDALKQESDINEALAELSSALISSKSIGEISALVLESARSFTGSKLGYAGYIEPETSYLICPTLTRDVWKECYVEDKNIVKSCRGLCGWVLHDRTPLIINSPAEDPRSTGTSLGHLPIHRFLSAPAIDNGMLVGQIALANSDREYTQQDLELTERLAEFYALAINRKRSEDELALKAQLLNSANDSIVLHDFGGKYYYVNEVACKFYGYTMEEMMQKSVFDLNTPQSVEGQQSRINELKTKGRVVFEAVNSRKDGSHIPVEVNASVINIRGKQFVLSVARDITRRKQVVEELRASEEKYRTIFNATGTAAMIIEEDTTISLINSEFEIFSGYAKEEIEGKRSWKEFFIQENLDDMIRYHNLRRVDPDTAPKQYETEFITRKGDVKQIIITVTMIPGTKQSIGFFLDISGIKKAQAALRESEEQLRQITDNMLDMISLVDERGIFQYVSPSHKNVLGYEPEFLNGKSLLELSHLYHPDDLDRVLAEVNLRTKGQAVEYRLRYSDSHYHWLESVGNPLYDENCSFKGSVFSTRDITERKTAEEALKQSEEKYRSLVVNLNDVIYTLNAEGCTTYISPVIERFAGYKAMEIIGKPFMSYIHPDDLQGLLESFRRALSGQPEPAEFRILKKDGTFIYVRSFSRMIEDNGQVSLTGLLSDITERKRAEEKLGESFAKLEKTFEQTVESLSSLTEMRDPYTAGHQVRVANLACKIASELGMSKEQVDAIRVSALIHDIGKIIIPPEILNKPGKLSVLERSFVETHARASYEILKKIEFALPIAEIVLQHHEKLDGSGYPQGLSGDSILKEARVLTVADIVEAMASHRPYRPALPLKVALEEIGSHGGTLYDADVVDACLRLFLKKGFSLSSLSYPNPA
jgi:PAS domain S-box-containing protein/putative nucleotidyltransferase with HDIG domain